MTFFAPSFGLVVAGVSPFAVKTYPGESCCAATESARIARRVIIAISNVWTRLKKPRGRGAGNTRDRAKPILRANGRRGLVLELRASLYATRPELAVTPPVRYVSNLTVTLAVWL